MTNFGDDMSGGRFGNNSYRHRSFLLAAPSAHIEHPGQMTQEERTYLAKLIASYKEHIRPLVRTSDVYHILPRPDGMQWDGLEYFDPQTGNGVLMVFKPESSEKRQVIPLRGLEPEAFYEITFEDQTNPDCTKSGAELLTGGLEITLQGTFVAEWIFLRQVQEKKG